MSKIMLVNVTHVEESRVAIVNDGVLEQYEIETINRASIKGNIYNAVVENLLPSIEAGFVRIAGDLKGFLPLDEVNFRLLPGRGESRGKGRIGQHLHPGQKLIVQVVREAFAGKPPTVTTYFSLPGRYLVLMPGVDASGISRKIEEPERRERLKTLMEELKVPEGFGLIVRTAGINQSKTELQRDLRYLLRLWESVQRSSRDTEFPGLIYRERDLVLRTLRDYFSPDIQEVWIDSSESYERALDFVRDVMPGKTKIFKLYAGERPIFSEFNLEEQIESIYKRRVLLKPGGEIVIDGTEAMTAIDVNSGRAGRQGDAEETAVQTNIEAAAEIARQLRLRDLGGLVVVDFIDMNSLRNRKRVEKAMRDAMKADKAKYDVTGISKLGLMEVSRQRIKGEKMGASYTTCPTCEGFGLVKNVESAALSALRKLHTRLVGGDYGRIRMAVPPEIALWILNHKREDLSQLERRFGVRVAVEPKASLLRHAAEFEFFQREKAEAAVAVPAALGERPAPPPPPDLKEIQSLTEAAVETGAVARVPAPSGGAPPEGSGRRRRRRRRRRGRGGAEVAVGEPQVTAAPAGDRVAADDLAGATSATEAFEDAPPVASDETAVRPGVEGAEGADGAEASSQGGRKRRRRRRRRRRGRGREPTPPGAGGEVRPHASAAPVTGGSGAEREEDPAVPRHVRVEELMPAATGTAQRKQESVRWGSRRRRPRGVPPGTHAPQVSEEPLDDEEED